MIIWSSRFNTYLLLSLLGVLLAGCRSAESKRANQLATFRVHAEVRGQSDTSKLISVFRSSPIVLYVEKEPFLTEGMVKEAKVIDLPGGAFSLQVQLTKHATLLLEQYSARSLSKHIAIFAEFGPQEKRKIFAEARWLAAPVIDKRIANGMLVFTPDADHKEAEEIALGLNSVARKRKAVSYIDEE